MDEALLTRSALVSRVLPFSCVDGLGNRLVLFLQELQLPLPGCHNPTLSGCATIAATAWRSARVAPSP